MLNSDISYMLMQERVRDLRAEADAVRDAGLIRRARRFWEERAQTGAVRRPHRAPRATAAGRTVPTP